MYRYPPSIIHIYLDLPSPQIIQTHNSHRHNTQSRAKHTFDTFVCLTASNCPSGHRRSGHSGLKLLCKLCRTSPPPAMGARFIVFWACRPCGPAGWLALLLTKVGDVETNPGPTTRESGFVISAINKYMSESRYP